MRLKTRNRFIGFGILGISMGVARSLTIDNEDIVLYNAENKKKIKWSNQGFRDRVFYSSMALALGGLCVLSTGSLVWAVPGATMYGVTLLYNFSQKKDLSGWKYD